MIGRLQATAALEKLFMATDISAEVLVAYHTLQNFIIGCQDLPDKVVSNVPLILQGVNKQGAYEYARRTIKSPD